MAGLPDPDRNLGYSNRARRLVNVAHDLDGDASGQNGRRHQDCQDLIPWNGGTGTLTVDGIVTTPTTDATYLKIVPRAGQRHIKTFVWVPS